MNRTIMILHLLVSISVARPIGEEPTAIREDRNYKTDDLVPRSPDEIEDVLSVIVKKDDILTTSDLTRIYNLLENKIGKIRSLKEQPENEGYKYAELENQNRAAIKSKSAENIDVQAQEKSYTTVEVEENRASNKKDKLEEKWEDKSGNTFKLLPQTNGENRSDNTSGRTTIAQLEEKIDTTNTEDVESKASTKEKRKSEITRDNELKSTTETIRTEDYAPEYLENDSDNYEVDTGKNGNGNYANDIKDKNSSKEKSGSSRNDRVETNDRRAPNENSRNDKNENADKRAPKEDSTSNYRNSKVESNDKHALKEDSRSGYSNYKVESEAQRAPKEDFRSGYPNDKGEINGKSAFKEDKKRKGYKMPINDESNSSWDLLDDIPLSRRMLTHDNFNIEIKGKAAHENIEYEEDINAPEVKPIISRNENLYDPSTPQYGQTVLNPEIRSTDSVSQFRSTVPIPQYQSNIPNPEFQRNVLNPQIQTTLNPQFPSTVLHPQTQSTIPKPQFENTALNPQFPSTVLNSQFQSVPNLPFPGSVLNPQFQRTVSIPHIHPSLLPIRRFIIPGLIKIRPTMPIDIRRLFSQVENNVPHQNIPSKIEKNLNEKVNYRNDRSETPESRELNIEDHSNAYPYELEKPQMPQIAMVNPIFSKLVEASQHPQRFDPNFNRGNVQNIPYNEFP